MSEKLLSLPDLPTDSGVSVPAQGRGRALDPVDVGIAGRSFDLNMREFKAGVEKGTSSFGDLGELLIGRGFDYYKDKAIGEAGFPVDPDYEPLEDDRFLNLPERYQDIMLTARSYGEGTVLLRMFEKQLAKDRFLAQAGPMAGVGRAVGEILTDAPVLMATGPVGLLAGFPLYTAGKSAIRYANDPSFTVEEGVSHTAMAFGFGAALTGLHYGVRSLRMGTGRKSPEQYAREINDETLSMESGFSSAEREAHLVDNAIDLPEAGAAVQVKALNDARMTFESNVIDLMNDSKFLDNPANEHLINGLIQVGNFLKESVEGQGIFRNLEHFNNFKASFHDLMDQAAVAVGDTGRAIDVTALKKAVDDIPFFRAEPPIQTERSILNQYRNVNDSAGMKGLVNQMAGSGHITEATQKAMIAVLDVMPDNFFRDASFRIANFGKNVGNGGSYQFLQDIIKVYGVGLALRPAASAGGKTLAHEVNHRVFFSMASEAELKFGRKIFDDVQIRPETKEFIERYNKKEHFSEWFAEEAGHYWVRRIEQGPAAALTFLEKLHTKNALELANLFERMFLRVYEFGRRLAGKPEITVGLDQMMDDFFLGLTKRIDKKSARAIQKDMEKFRTNRAVRFDDEFDFLTGPRGAPNTNLDHRLLRSGETRLLDEVADTRPVDDISSGMPFERNFDPGDGARLIPAWMLEKLPDSPVKRLLESDNAFSRHIASYLVEHPFYQRQNALGKVTPHGVDRNVAVEWIAPMVDALKATDDFYKAYRQRFHNEAGRPSGQAVPHDFSLIQIADDKLRGSGGAVTRNEFMIQVGRAKIRMQRTEGPGADLLPEAVQAATVWDTKVYRRAGEAAQEAGVFSISQRRRISHLQAKLSELEASTNTGLGMTVKQLRYWESLESQIAALQKEASAADSFALDPNYMNRIWLKNVVEERRQELTAIFVKQGGYTAEEASGKIEAILNGKPFTEIGEDLTGTARSIKQREVDIDSIYLEDFIELNVAAAGRYYATRIGADIELTRQFGSIDLKEIVDGIRSTYADDIFRADPKYLADVAAFEKAAGNGGPEGFIPPKPNKAAAPIVKAMEGDIRDIQGIRDRIRGTYGIPDDPTTWTNRGIRVAKMWNATSLLTGALAATPDLAKTIFSDGLTRTIGTTLEAFKSDIGFLATAKLAKREAELAGEALDMYLSMRSALFADLADSLSAVSPLERKMADATQQFFNIAGMNPWNEAVKTMASLITGSRIIEESANLVKGRINKTELTKLSNVGIDVETARVIVEQTEKHGMAGERVRIAKTQLWDKTAEAQAAAAIYTRALGKDINRIIVTPGKGETPLFMSKPIMGLILQFKTFAISATHRTLTPGLQLKDQNFLMGVIASVGLGALVNEIRRYQLGITSEQDFGDWLASSIDRSGVIGAVTDLNGALETLSDNRFGLRPLLGSSKSFGSSGLSQLGVFGGPTVQQAGNAARVLWDLGPGNVDERTVNSAKRLIPMSKLFWTDGLFDLVEDGANALVE